MKLIQRTPGRAYSSKVTCKFCVCNKSCFFLNMYRNVSCKDHYQYYSSLRCPPDIDLEENQGSTEHSSRKRMRTGSVSSSSSRSATPQRKLRSQSRSLSPEIRQSRSRTKSRSRSSSRSASLKRSIVATPSNSSVSREVTPVKGEDFNISMDVASPASANEVNGTEGDQTLPQQNVSSVIMLNSFLCFTFEISKTSGQKMLVHSSLV